MARETSTVHAGSRRRMVLAVCIIVGMILIDQFVKIYIKTHFALHDSVKVFNWFYLYFTENNGMAFGWEIFNNKIFLTLFRIAAAGVLVWLLVRICRRPKYPTGVVVCVALIIAGALGNVIDCMFYGLGFSDSAWHIAEIFPAGGGYAPMFYGRVVDMIYCPIIDANWPAWMPFCGGEHFIFFSPVFNVADSCITCGVLILLIFYHKVLK